MASTILMGDETLISLNDVDYSYGAVPALINLNMAVTRGEIHALVGEHGAGKSSLAMTISGELQPKRGHIVFEGRRYLQLRSTTALRLGIKMVHQQILLNEYFTVAENLFYSNRSINRGFWVSQNKMKQAAEALFTQYGIRISAYDPISGLNLSERTVVDIMKSLQTETKLLIIDEGLDNLSTDYYRKMLPILFDRKTKGMSILLITHKIDDIYEVADRVSIMRDGRILATDNVRKIDKMTLLRMTYTQMTKSPKPIRDAREFHNFLKYNEAILQFLPVNLIVTDQQNRITLVNDFCKQYFNLTDQYFDTPLEVIFQEGNRDIFDLLLKAFGSDEGKTFYHLKLVFDADTTMTNIKTLPIKDGSVVIGNIVIIEDVTEFERMQQRLILSEKLASVGLLAAGVAHEINNPLEIIQNYLSFIRYNFPEDRLLSVVDTIQNEIVNISGIVSNLVSFSDKRSTDFEIVDVDEVVAEIIGLLKYNAQYKRIEVDCKPSAKCLRLSVNRNELKQVILNLIKNSFEAMPDGGSISIRTFIALEDGQPKAKIVVGDTGPGIAEEDIKNIFLPFFSTKKGKENNLGLGLSVSYAIIQRYGGSIIAMNNEYKGSSFTITLPTTVEY